MPTQVFNNLDKEKKDRIFNASLKEFSSTTLEKASIKNITQNANIARASFYAYFENKEDILLFVVNKLKQKMSEQFHIETNIEGDIFKKIKNAFTTRLNYVYNNLNNNCGITLIRQLTKSTEGRNFVLKHLSHEDMLHIKMANKVLKVTTYENLGKEQTYLLIELLINISKNTLKKVMKQEINKEQALNELDFKFSLIKEGIKNN